MCRCATLCEHFFPVQIDVFSVFCQKEIRKQPKFHILLILTGKNASKWLEWHIFRVQGMPNPMPQVLHLCNKQFLKNHNFRQKIHILLILTEEKCNQNCLSGTYLGFKACQIQWHFLQVSTICGSWKFTIVGDTYQKMGFKTMKMAWDICSSPPWGPFYPYTMLQNPISWPSHKNAEKP